MDSGNGSEDGTPWGRGDGQGDDDNNRDWGLKDIPNDVEVLKRVWRNEKSAPEILAYEFLRGGARARADRQHGGEHPRGCGEPGRHDAVHLRDGREPPHVPAAGVSARPLHY
ncbi:hypothetical protein KC19_2G133600 [Ceratodon purpureus]|uniref:Uncharacterized protein n=1 Tax=Ceratodon purpureus TaxID=3225 RepID=A0A8T0IV37_CERPU|nr:hypothetical protein KC19_2G133600 [Ceratodon purpureus]